MARYVNATTHPITLDDGSVVAATEAFDAAGEYADSLVADGIAVEADPQKSATKRGKEET